MKKHTILFLAANPSGTDRLALDLEAHLIRAALEHSSYRDLFELETRWAVRPLDLLRELRRLRPTVVHFSGHGGQPGLFFQDWDGRAQLVSTAALEETFGAAGASVKLVVLNACYTEAQAEALLAHVDCVVGMRGSIHHDAIRIFAIGFYGGLGEREPVEVAYRQGRAAISLEGLSDGDRAQLKVRAGIDASQIVLAAEHQASITETSLAVVAIRKKLKRDFPVFYYTIRNNGTNSQILTSIRISAHWIACVGSIAQTRALTPLQEIDIILPQDDGILLLDMPSPILIAPDDAATIGVRFACGSPDRPFTPISYGICEVIVSFVSDRGLYAESAPSTVIATDESGIVINESEIAIDKPKGIFRRLFRAIKAMILALRARDRRS